MEPGIYNVAMDAVQEVVDGIGIDLPVGELDMFPIEGENPEDFFQIETPMTPFDV